MGTNEKKQTTMTFHLNTRKGNQALAQVAHRGCGVNLHGDIQHLTGCSPEQPAVCGPS